MKSITTGLFCILIIDCLSSRAQVAFENFVVGASTIIASSFINDNEGWLADNNLNLWHTGDAGQTWNSIPVEKNFLQLQFIDALDGYALSENTAYKTIDGGQSWSALSLPDGIGIGLYFFDANTGFISGHQQIYRTVNGGSTWQTIATDDASFVDFYFINSSTGIAAANDDASSRSIWRTTDGGFTWSNVYNRPKYFMNAVWLINENNGFAAGCYDQVDAKAPEILRTTDGGLTWTPVYRNQEIIRPGETLTDIHFRNINEGVAISNYSESVYTKDGGATWTRFYEDENSGLPQSQPLYKTIGGRNDLYIGGESGYVVTWK